MSEPPMSERDEMRDPIDKAYAQAEAVLDDPAARAARRARVLAAVAAAPAEPVQTEAPPATAPRTWGRGGWLIAASVVGLSVLVAIRITPQGPRPTAEAPPAATTAATAPAAAPAEAPAPAQPAARPAAHLPDAPPRKALAAPAGEPSEPAASYRAPTVALAPPPPAPAPAPQFAPLAVSPAPPPPPAAQARAFRAAPVAVAPATGVVRGGEINELVVTGEKRQPSVAHRAELVAGSDLDRAERLRTAAAQGQTEDVAALLSGGVPVDSVDKDGETALMKAVQADAPETAGLLRRRGARLDRKNRAGLSVLDMAAKVADPALNEALGLKP